jgi:hypothetical protein
MVTAPICVSIETKAVSRKGAEIAKGEAVRSSLRLCVRFFDCFAAVSETLHPKTALASSGVW